MLIYIYIYIRVAVLSFCCVLIYYSLRVFVIGERLTLDKTCFDKASRFEVIA